MPAISKEEEILLVDLRGAKESTFDTSNAESNVEMYRKFIV